jgi:hypothetical protein
MYRIIYFADLCNQFTTWNELSTFLQSEEGGSLRIIEEAQYAIIRYVKGKSDLYNAKKPWVPWFRSVVWNKQTNRPVCVAPRKAQTGDIPSDRPLEVQEFLEGVMVNAFYEGSGDLQLATRSSLGATTGFYSTRSFSELFQEALKEKEQHTMESLQSLLVREFPPINNSVDSSLRGAFASFVLQHPEHRVVSKIEKPDLYVIHTGYVEPNGDVFLNTELRCVGLWLWKVPQYEQKLEPGQSAQERLNETANLSSPNWQGLVFRDPQTGDRWRLRTVSYKLLRELRGKESRSEERFVRLRSQNMLRLYTQSFTEEREPMFELEKRLRGLTAKLYKEYCSVHKEKSKAFLDIEIPLRTPIYQLHGMYLNTLKGQNKTLKMQNVIQYVNNMTPEVLGPLLRSNVDLTIHQEDL